MIFIETIRFSSRVLLGAAILAANHGMLWASVAALAFSYLLWIAGEVEGT